MLKDILKVRRLKRLSPLFSSSVLLKRSVYLLLSMITGVLFFLRVFTPYFILISQYDKLNILKEPTPSFFLINKEIGGEAFL